MKINVEMGEMFL